MYADNIAAIREFLVSTDRFMPGCYFFIELIVRKKDFPEGECGHDHQICATYFVSSPEKFDAVIPEIKALCHLHNARAYINLNRKSMFRTSYILMHELLEVIENGCHSTVFSRMTSAAGKCPGEKTGKTFLVDVDTDDEDVFNCVYSGVLACAGTVHAQLRTPSGGWHLVTSPFNTKQFMELVAEHKDVVELKHNSPTVLYYGGYGDA